MKYIQKNISKQKNNHNKETREWKKLMNVEGSDEVLIKTYGYDPQIKYGFKITIDFNKVKVTLSYIK